MRNRKFPDQLTIGVVAGEASGDNLGGPLLEAIRAQHPSAKFIGIGGPKMVAAGLDAWLDIEQLSVNGFIEPLKRLPFLLRTLLDTRDRVVAAKVDCFIGVDFNFFNLMLEKMLKKRGVRTVHYVSPTVWAWRRWRINGIRKSVDLMLTLYPFETRVYADNDIDAVFIGHPRADAIDPAASATGQAAAREQLQLSGDRPVVAMLPGSRASEVALTGPDFLQAAALIAKRVPDVAFIIPAANDRRYQQLQEQVEQYADNLCITINRDSTLAMQASDVVMVNSGTATLEAMLLKKPMVVSYRLGPVTYAIVSRMVKIEHFALPNILAGKPLVPELIQDDATPEALCSQVVSFLEDDHSAMLEEFDRIHRSLRKDAAVSAANAVLDLCGQ